MRGGGRAQECQLHLLLLLDRFLPGPVAGILRPDHAYRGELLLARVAPPIRPAGELTASRGLLVGAFRPLYFNALCLVQQRRWRELDILLSGREGYLFGPDVRFSWQTSAELAAVFNSQSGLTLELLAGVGVCSGIEGDPHAAVARPSLIPSHDLENFFNHSNSSWVPLFRMRDAICWQSAEEFSLYDHVI